VEASSSLLLHKPEPRLWIEFSAVEFPAAIQACDRAFDPPDPRKFFPAPRTTIEKSPGARANRKRQGMTARFIRDAEIAASPAPLCAVRRNAPRTSAELGKQVGEFVAQGAIDLGGIVFAQPWIERDQVTSRIGAARGAEETRVPFHLDFARELLGVERRQDFPRSRFERGITSENDNGRRRRKDEIELSKQRHASDDSLRRRTERD
jgi:hypothetical protein